MIEVHQNPELYPQL